MELSLQNKIYRLVLRIVNNVHEAEDVVQEVLVKIWKKQDKIKEIENKEAYYMVIARNQALDSLRKKKLKTNDIDEYYHIKDNNATPDNQIESKDRMKQINNMINMLPEKQKIVLQLRDIEGYSYKEIAKIANLTENQVKVNLHRARLDLRKQILSKGIRSASLS